MANGPRNMRLQLIQATIAALFGAAPVAAQGGPVTSGVAQVQLVATVLPTAHLDGLGRMVGWHRSEGGQEGLATLGVLPNAPYRLVVSRTEEASPAKVEAAGRIWVEGVDGALAEVRMGLAVEIRRSGVNQGTQVTLRVRADLAGSSSASPTVLPLRYDIQVEPTL